MIDLSSFFEIHRQITEAYVDQNDPSELIDLCEYISDNEFCDNVDCSECVFNKHNFEYLEEAQKQIQILNLISK